MRHVKWWCGASYLDAPLFGGSDRGLVAGDCGLSRIVIPSAAEGSLLHCGNQRVCTEGKRCPGAVSHQAMSVLQ